MSMNVAAAVVRRRVSVISAGLLVLVVAGTAAAGSGIGGVFNLGATNTVNALTQLVGNYSKMLHIKNTSTSTSSFVLGLQTAYGTPLQLIGSTSKPPFTTNSGVKVANLNADKLDGLDQSAFLRSTGTAAAARRVSTAMTYAVGGTEDGQPIPAGGYGFAFAVCPSGTAPTGGGYEAYRADDEWPYADVTAIAESAAFSVASPTAADAWLVLLRNDEATLAADVFVTANCAPIARGTWLLPAAGSSARALNIRDVRAKVQRLNDR